MHKPSWFQDDKILIINAATCGINKDGHEQYIVDVSTGCRSDTEIDDALAADCEMVEQGMFKSKSIRFVDYNNVSDKDVFVPKYYDEEFNEGITNFVKNNNGFTAMSLRNLVDEGYIKIIGGHGSPSADQRIGEVPYIKVSDLRAGAVNINPTNRIPIALAKQYWKNEDSGLKPYDLISPERASKNIGEFCVLMPGQENVVLTKEVIVIRALLRSKFDQFYLMWALSLIEVRKQWERIVFMQTNREDVGKRMYEIMIPVPKSRSVADKVSMPFKEYYECLETARNNFIDKLSKSGYKYHIHLGTGRSEDK